MVANNIDRKTRFMATAPREVLSFVRKESVTQNTLQVYELMG